MEIVWSRAETYKCRCCVRVCLHKRNLNAKISVTIKFYSEELAWQIRKYGLSLFKHPASGIQLNSLAQLFEFSSAIHNANRNTLHQ